MELWQKHRTQTKMFISNTPTVSVAISSIIDKGLLLINSPFKVLLNTDNTLSV